MLSSIGSFQFTVMREQPQGISQRLQLESKAGVAGVAVWKLGAAGTQHTVNTLRDYASWSTAVAAEAAYKTLKDAGPVEIYFGGVYLGTVIVLDVRSHATRIAAGIGGLSGESTAIVEATWTIIAV